MYRFSIINIKQSQDCLFFDNRNSYTGKNDIIILNQPPGTKSVSVGLFAREL